MGKGDMRRIKDLKKKVMTDKSSKRVLFRFLGMKLRTAAGIIMFGYGLIATFEQFFK